MGNEKTMTCSKKCLDIPVWRRYTLTIEEAAGYYHIGEGKLRMLIDEHPNEDFYVFLCDEWKPCFDQTREI